MSKNGILNGAGWLWKRPRGNRLKGPKNGGKIADKRGASLLTIHDIDLTRDDIDLTRDDIDLTRDDTSGKAEGGRPNIGGLHIAIIGIFSAWLRARRTGDFEKIPLSTVI